MSGNRVDASEIARLAKVSRATVSRVINDYPFVKPETRKRVMEVIEKYSYTPNLSAQVLAGKSSKTIGFFFVGEEKIQSSRMEDIHFNFMMERVIMTAADHGYYVMINKTYNINDSAEKQRIQDMFFQSRIDAGIFVGFPNNYMIIEDLIAKGYVVGIFDQHISGRHEPNRIVVNFDTYGTELAIDYAIGLGHKDIMIINGDPLHKSGTDKMNAYIKSMERNKLEIRKEYILDAGKFTCNSAQSAFLEFLKKGIELPTCIFSGNDIMAYGVMEILQKRGYRIPEDISVIGSDDMLISSIYNPPLTTIHYDFDAIMETLTVQVIACARGTLPAHFHKEFSGKLVIRNSCSSPRI